MFLTRICAALEEVNISYAIIGGYAVALHGAVRGTIDLDLAIALELNAFIKVAMVLLKLGLRSRLPVSADQVFSFRKEYIENRNLIAWSFYDPAHPAHEVDIIITEDASRIKVKSIRIRGVRVKIAAISDLIRMKMRSGRPQDLEDVKALKELSKVEKK